MSKLNFKSGLLFATRLALAAVFAVIFFGLISASVNAAADGWHIKDDATGGECSAIGNWDAGNKMCTLTQDLSQGIIIDSDNVILDGDGRTITGRPTGKGISLVGRTGVTIKNLDIEQFSQGIYLDSSNNNTLTGNTASNNGSRGIYLENSSNNTLTGNTASNNGDTGIFLFYPSNNNTLTNNTASLNNTNGILILESSNNTLTNNTVQENRFDIAVQASLDSYCNNSITNTTGSGGRPIKYFSSAVSLSDETLSELILCNADGSSMHNVTIDDGSATSKNNGLILNRTDSSTIENVNSSNNFNGIFLYYSNNNILTDNTASNNAYNGIALDGSNNNNTLTGNIASNNTNGIFIRGSSNTLTGNTASNNSTFGIYLSVASNSTLIDNTASNNNHTGIYLDFSNNNTLTGNTVSNNNNGIYLYSSNNQIYKNNFISNSTQAVDSGGGNVFDLASPVGGNYWSNFDESSEGCNDVNGDGFCDAPYIFTGGQDNFPWTKKDGWITPPNQPKKMRNPTIGGRITQLFDNSKTAARHLGIDIDHDINGRPVYATANGTVIRVVDPIDPSMQPWGKWVWIYHGDIMDRDGSTLSDISTLYLHLDEVNRDLRAGNFIAAGTKLGVVDSTGLFTGPHLHFSVRKGPAIVGEQKPSSQSISLDPLKFVDYELNPRQFSINALSPVDIIATDPDGLRISKEINQIPDTDYIEVKHVFADPLVALDPDGEVHDYDTIQIAERKNGDYFITVVPEQNTTASSTYSLAITYGTTTDVLVENIAVADIPVRPYIVRIAGDTVTQIIPADIRVRPSVFKLNEGGKFFAEIKMPAGYAVTVNDILQDSISLNGAPPYNIVLLQDRVVGIFNRKDILATVSSGMMQIMIKGMLSNGVKFEGVDYVRVVP